MHGLFTAGLGQRFLQRFVANSEDSEAPGPMGHAGSLHMSPKVSSGHLQGEGVRNYATLLAEASARMEARSREGSSHGPSR